MSLRCTGIEKSFGRIRALDAASLSVKAGSIHALLGENGAGKSTLNNIIAGAFPPDEGTIELNGQRVRFASPLDAARAGIGMVHQHFLLIDAFTVAENVALGIRESNFGLRFDRKSAEARVAELAQRTGLLVDPTARVSSLSVGMRQRVEIIKALARGAKILLLDEPTAVLAPAEIDRLFETLRVLRSEGRTIVIVTHKLDEVFSLAEDLTVLRKGATVLTGKIADVSRAEVIRAMIGGNPAPLMNVSLEIGSSVPIECAVSNLHPMLQLKSVVVPSLLDVAELSVNAGEIVGVAGVEGNGQDELAGAISGTLRGTVRANLMNLGGINLTPLSIRERSEAGIAWIPSDRHREGLVLEMPLAENLFLRKPLERSFAGLHLLDRALMNSKGEALLRDFGATPADPRLTAGALSGGNQQKAVAARELSRAPNLILACNPTRGLDVGAAAAIQNRLLEAKQRGAAVLLVSSDLDEVLALSDRVYALYRGKLSPVGARGVSRDAVGKAMMGTTANREVAA